MSPRVILIIVILLLIVFGGMALTMKRAADKRRDRTAFSSPRSLVIPAKAGIQFAWVPASAGMTITRRG